MDKEVDSYRQAFEDARAELEALLEEESFLEERRAEIKYRTEGLRKTVDNLGLLIGENSSEQAVGITDAIRELIKENTKYWFSAPLVRMFLRKREFPVDEYKQPLAVIHTTLKRLQDQGELKSEDHDGRTRYSWDEESDLEISDDDIPF